MPVVKGVSPSGPGSRASHEADKSSSPKASIPDADGYFTLSNGAKVFVGGNVGDWEQSNIDLVERMIAAGHVPKTDDDGSVDFFYMDMGYHNGPGCDVCGASACQHCQPEWEPGPCPGAEAVAAEKRERRYQRYLELKEEFEPAQGIEARSDETAQQAQPEGREPGPEGDAP